MRGLSGKRFVNFRGKGSKFPAAGAGGAPSDPKRGFGKHASRARHRHLDRVFHMTPVLIGRRINLNCFSSIRGLPETERGRHGDQRGLPGGTICRAGVRFRGHVIPGSEVQLRRDGLRHIRGYTEIPPSKYNPERPADSGPSNVLLKKKTAPRDMAFNDNILSLPLYLAGLLPEVPLIFQKTSELH